MRNYLELSVLGFVLELNVVAPLLLHDQHHNDHPVPDRDT